MHKDVIAFGLGIVLAAQLLPATTLAYGGGGFMPSVVSASNAQGRVLGAATVSQVERERIIAFIQQRIVEIRALLDAYRRSHR